MSASGTVRVVIAAAPPARLDKALARDAPEAVGLSRSRLARLIAQGAVSRDGAPVADAAAPVTAGAAFDIALPAPAPATPAAEAIPLAVAYEDAELVVVDKPAGMVVHPGPGAETGTLAAALRHHCGAALSTAGGADRPGIVHRLDKGTSGLLVAAKTDRAHRALAAQFKAHTVARRYLGVCRGILDPADARLRARHGVTAGPGATLRIETDLARHPRDRQRRAVVTSGGRRAVTRLHVAERLDRAARLDLTLETGRTHQIRVHAAHIGHPLVGDPTYGRGRRGGGPDAAARFPRQALHAATLGFRHPLTGAPLAFETPPPADLADLLAALRAPEPPAED